MKDEIIYSKISDKFDLSTQAILIPKKNRDCLYFDLENNNNFVLELFGFFLKQNAENNFFYLANGYRSNLSSAHFLKINKEFLLNFFSSENLIFKDYSGSYTPYEFDALGVILIDESFSWIIHRDADFGTISFGYRKSIDLKIIAKLKESRFYLGDIPKQEFYDDVL
jgi:hypothetical protein